MPTYTFARIRYKLQIDRQDQRSIEKRFFFCVIIRSEFVRNGEVNNKSRVPCNRTLRSQLIGVQSYLSSYKEELNKQK